jgi:hypothetical protein
MSCTGAGEAIGTSSEVSSKADLGAVDVGTFFAEVAAICDEPWPTYDFASSDPAVLTDSLNALISAFGARVAAIDAIDPPASEEVSFRQYLVEPMAKAHQGILEHQAAYIEAAQRGPEVLARTMLVSSGEISPEFTDEGRAWLSNGGMNSCRR